MGDRCSGQMSADSQRAPYGLLRGTETPYTSVDTRSLRLSGAGAAGVGWIIAPPRPAGPLSTYFMQHCSTFLMDSQECFATTPLPRPMLYRCGRATRVTRSGSAGCLPEGRQGRSFSRPFELILAVVGYGPPPNGERSNPPGH